MDPTLQDRCTEHFMAMSRVVVRNRELIHELAINWSDPAERLRLLSELGDTAESVVGDALLFASAFCTLTQACALAIEIEQGTPTPASVVCEQGDGALPG